MTDLQDLEQAIEKSIDRDLEANKGVVTKPYDDAEVSDLNRRQKEEALAGRVQDRTERKEVGRKLLSLVQFWLIGVFFLLFWQGFGSKIGFFKLEDSVLNTLLVTTTANLIGLLYVIAKYLYHEKRIDPDAPRKKKLPSEPRDPGNG